MREVAEEIRSELVCDSRGKDRDSMDNETADILAPAPGNIRMDAYYYSFERTGVGVIDEILSAVAQAGSGYHHTESWSDDYDGPSYVDQIQEAANRAANAIRAVVTPGNVSEDDRECVCPADEGGVTIDCTVHGECALHNHPDGRGCGMLSA